MDVISIGAIAPFLAVLINPETLLTNAYAKPIVDYLNIKDSQQLMLLATTTFILTVVLAFTFRFIQLWVQVRLGNSIGSDLGIQIFRKTLYQPYSIHITRNSSQIISGVVSKVDSIVNGVLLPLLTACGSVITFVLIRCMFMVLNPVISAGVVFF